MCSFCFCLGIFWVVCFETANIPSEVNANLERLNAYSYIKNNASLYLLWPRVCALT